MKFADLDQEIEKFEGKTITQIFTDKGEAHFRGLEKKVWDKISNYNVVAVGGGFNLDWIQSDWKTLWARRDSDSADRIFLDRPAIADYKKKFEEREVKFQKRSDLIYTIPEGLFEPDPQEKEILLNQFGKVGGTITLPKHLYTDVLIEVRDDLEKKEYATDNLLYSVRQGTEFPKDKKIDWDIKRPIPSGLTPYIISTHENDLAVLLPFENTEAILKYCPVVESWSDLEKGISWQKKNSEKHVFLPRSMNGRWSWFRLWMKGKQPLNFWREGAGSALDQPTLWQWLSHPKQASNFAAVLGAPVQHSFSPTYHKSYFLEAAIPFYAIHVEENEWDVAIPILNQLGLVAAAVTSPLKIKAGEYVNQSSTNTLWKQNDTWLGANTDKAGALALLQDHLNRKCAVWGGGGVLDVLKSIMPEASYYSAREGKPRAESSEIANPEVVIWGDPHNSISRVPKSWKPKTVIDLSYHDKSPARLYSLEVGASYISGLEMFVRQADEQQKIWK